MKPSLKARGTLKDVARAVGVSHTTVSNAFNRPDQLSRELRDRIVAAARAMDYPGPNPAARMLRTGFAKTIAVVWTDPLPHAFEDQAAASFLAGVSEVCAARNLGMLLVQGGNSSSRGIQAAAVDALILYSLPNDDNTLQMVADRKLPTVVVDQPTTVTSIPFVGIDDRAASQACARHLKDLGHERFAIVSLRMATDGFRGLVSEQRLRDSKFELSENRIRGYLDVLDQNENALPTPVWECPYSFEEEGRNAAENLLNRLPRPTAILASSDRLALGVMEAARARSLRIPEDLSVVGFDDIPASQLVSPQLTTISQPLREKGRLATLILLDGNQLLRRNLAAKLVVRKSTCAVNPQDQISCRRSPPAPY